MNKFKPNLARIHLKCGFNPQIKHCTIEKLLLFSVCIATEKKELSVKSTAQAATPTKHPP